MKNKLEIDLNIVRKLGLSDGVLISYILNTQTKGGKFEEKLDNISRVLNISRSTLFRIIKKHTTSGLITKSYNAFNKNNELLINIEVLNQILTTDTPTPTIEKQKVIDNVVDYPMINTSEFPLFDDEDELDVEMVEDADQPTGIGGVDDLIKYLIEFDNYRLMTSDRTKIREDIRKKLIRTFEEVRELVINKL